MALSIKRAEQVVDLCLDMSLRAEWEQAHGDLVKARGGLVDERLAGGSSVKESAKRVRDLEARMQGEVVQFRLRALPRNAWSALVAAHPARKDHAQDGALGVNVSEFFDAVLAHVDPVTVAAVSRDGEPVEFDPATDWRPLADEISDGQYGQFVDAVLELNRGSTSVPFSRAASRPNRDSSETSK